MARILKQVSYYGGDAEAELKEKLTNGEYFKNIPIYAVDIMAPPGTKFYFNNNKENNMIRVDSTGYFSYEVPEQSVIFNITFQNEENDKVLDNRMKLIKQTGLLINYICEE